MEFVDHKQGQRAPRSAIETGIGWQHGFSPQIEIRRKVSYHRSLEAFAFNGNANFNIPANKNCAIIGAADMIITSEA